MMKITKAFPVQGLYQQCDGSWQSAVVLTDGVSVGQAVSCAIGDAPQIGAAALTGIEAARGTVPTLSAQQIADQGGGTVVSDMRESDLQMGGQGGPLHPFYLHALARAQEHPADTAYVLAGDQMSLTWVNPKIADPTDPAALISFETGPGYAALGDLSKTHQGGEVVDGALELFLDDAYFRRLPPKWVEPTSFGPLLELVRDLSAPDARTTLLGMAATSVLLGMEHLPRVPSKVVVFGKGAADPLFMDLLQAALDRPLSTLDPPELGQTIHAQATAFLAARVIRGLPTTAPHTTKVAAAVGGGTITQSA